MLSLVVGIGIGIVVSVVVQFILRRREIYTHVDTITDTVPPQMGFTFTELERQAPVPLARVAKDDLAFIGVNARFAEVFGSDLSTFDQLVCAAEDEPAADVQTLIEKIEQGPLHTMMQSETDALCVQILCLERGESFYTVSCEPAFDTEEKPVEPAADADTRYQSILNAVADGVMLIDSAGLISYANPAAAELCDRKVRELESQPFSDVQMVALDAAPSPQTVRAKLKPGRRWVGEVLRVNRAGECLPTRVHLRRPTKYEYTVAIFHDLSSQSKLQNEVLEVHKLACLGEVTAGVTHELSNMLTAVLEGARFVQEGFEMEDLGPSAYEAAKDTVVGASRMRKILEEVRRFSHVGRRERIDLHVADAVGGVLALAAPTLRRNVKVRVPTEGGARIYADESRLTQVMLNLIKNAADAINETGRKGTIRIEFGQTETEGSISVIDDGPGIPEAVQRRLFRENITTKSVQRGTGFGLRLVKRLLEEDGGRIEFASKLGHGARFTIFLPLASCVEIPVPTEFASGPNPITLTTPTTAKRSLASKNDPQVVETTVDLKPLGPLLAANAGAGGLTPIDPTSPQMDAPNAFDAEVTDPVGNAEMDAEWAWADDEPVDELNVAHVLVSFARDMARIEDEPESSQPELHSRKNG